MPSRRRIQRAGPPDSLSPAPPQSPSPPNQSSLVPSFPMKPSTEVWSIPEVRLRIISLVESKKDLASLIRVEKKGMALVAGFLYREVTHKHATSKMSVSPPRRRMYENAISVLDCRSLELPRSIITKLGLDTKPSLNPPGTSRDSDVESEPESEGDEIDDSWQPTAKEVRAETKARVARYTATYHPELIELLIPFLLKRFPSLKKIIFGSEYQPMSRTASWVVDLGRKGQRQPAGGDAAAAGGSTAVGGAGHIEHVQRRCCKLDQMPPAGMPDPPQAPPGYTISDRWDLELSCPDRLPHVPAAAIAWLHALQESPLFRFLYQAVDFGRLSIPLPDITSLYQRHAAVGSAVRLQYIAARCAPSFDLAAFSVFAATTSSSLTHLILAKGGWMAGGFSVPPTMLSGFFSTARDALPHLKHLEIRLDQLEEADQLFRDTPHPHVLCGTGGVTVLRLHARSIRFEALHLLRYLSVIAARGASIWFSGDRGACKEVGPYLGFLHRHPPACQRNLTTVDFSQLGMTSFEDLRDITFDALDLPEHRLVTLTGRYLEKLSSPHHPKKVPPTDIAFLSGARVRLANATQKLIGISAAMLPDTSATSPDGEGRALLESQKLNLLGSQLAAVKSISWVPDHGSVSPSVRDTAKSMATDIEGLMRVQRVVVEAAAEKRLLELRRGLQAKDGKD